MQPYPTTILKSADHERLQTLMSTLIGSRSPTAALLRRKLGSASIVNPDEAAADLIASGRRVRFVIDGQHAEERTLTWQQSKRGDADSLSLRTPRGLALLGLWPGQSIAYETESRRQEVLEVAAVLPEDGDVLRWAERATGPHAPLT
ncbi:MAG: hypothetical protein EOP19_24650, partial [Hyphomicrobiales bacterium]